MLPTCQQHVTQSFLGFSQQGGAVKATQNWLCSYYAWISIYVCRDMFSNLIILLKVPTCPNIAFNMARKISPLPADMAQQTFLSGGAAGPPRTLSSRLITGIWHWPQVSWLLTASGCGLPRDSWMLKCERREEKHNLPAYDSCEPWQKYAMNKKVACCWRGGAGNNDMLSRESKI